MRQAYDYWQDQPGNSGAAERVCGRTRYYLTTHLQRQSLLTNNDSYQTFSCLHTRESEPAVVRCTFDSTRRCDTVDPDRAKLSHTGYPETIANCECVVCRTKRHKLYPMGNQRADHRTDTSKPRTSRDTSIRYFTDRQKCTGLDYARSGD